MTRLRATRAATPDGAVTVQASGQLMDDFVYATDLTGETDLTAVTQADGSYSLLYLGSSGNVMSLRQNPDSDTGWSEETIDTTLQPSQVVGATDAAGTFSVFAVSSNAAAPDIHVMTRDAGGNWSAPAPIAPDDSVPMFMQVARLAAFPIAGKVELFALLSPSPDHGGESSLWRIEWNAAKPAWHYLADSDQAVIESCTIAGAAGVLFANSAAANPTAFDLFTVASPFATAPNLLAATVMFRSLAVGTQADNNSAVFIADPGDISGQRQIQYLDGGQPGAGFRQIDTTIAVTALAVASAGSSPLALFALDDQGMLRFVASPLSDKSFDFFLRLTNIQTVTGKDGDAELLGYAPAKGLTRLWQSPPENVALPDGTQGGWNREPIQYQPVNQTLVEQKTYSNTLTFYDARGAVIANSKVNLKSTEIITATVAGEVLVLGPNRPIACFTDAAGRVRVTTPTRTLNISGLSASLPDLMQVGHDFAVTPNYDVQERLRNITKEQVIKLVPSEFHKDAEDIRTAVTESMANIHDGPVQLVQFRHKPRADLKLPLPMREPLRQPFRFTVANGRAVYETLTVEQADAAIAGIAALRADPEFGFFDFFEDAIEAIGDAFESAVDAVYTYVVKPVLTGFELAINWATDTLKIAWRGIVDTVESAFRFVETIFDAVKTFFKKLYDFLAWLLSDARKEIWAAKRQFERVFRQGLGSLAGFAGQGASVSHSFFLDVGQTVDQVFDKIEKDLTGQTFGQMENQPTSPSVLTPILEFIEDVQSVSTWLLDKLDVGIASGFDVGVEFPKSLMEQAQRFINQVETAVLKELGGQITTFLNGLQSIASSADDLGKALLGNLLEQARSIIQAVLRILDTAVQGFLGLISQALPQLSANTFETEIDSFFVEAIYDLMNPGASEPVTVIGISSLLLGAIAATTYRLIWDEAPFPTEETADANAAATINTWVRLSGVLQAFWSIPDAFFDVGGHKMRDTAMPAWKVLAMLIFWPTTVQLLAWPGGPGTAPSFDKAADRAKWTAWFTSFLGPAIVVAWAIGTKATGKPLSGPRPFPLGAGLLCVAGLATLGCNAWMLYERAHSDSDAQDWEKAAAIAAPFSGIVKPVNLFKNPYALGTVVIVDIGSNGAAGCAKAIQTG